MATTNPPPADLPSSDPQPSTQNTHTTPPSKSTPTPPPTNLPSTSLADKGLSRRPRDARLIHMVLANLGVTAYAERVPLQILDFAYRYTQSTLQDALHLSSEGYGASSTTGTGAGGGAGGGKGAGGGAGSAGADLGNVTLPALRLSVASRSNYQFQPSLPKEFLLELAAERNRVALPSVGRDWGVRLPHEKYCLTGVGWGLKEEWESEAEEEEGGQGDGKGMGEDEEDEGDERMEDIFGEQGDEGEDREMEDA